MNMLRTLLLGALALLFVSPVMAADPYHAANNSWISLSGTVVATSATTFDLDYGSGLVIVEMDGWGWYSAAYSILEGDKVTVYGRVDADLYETTTIEARSVYVKDINTYYYANDADEEDAEFATPTIYPDNGFQMRGRITNINGREFTMDTGAKKIKVDTMQMFYNPLDNKGLQKLKVGDLVQVTGKLDVNFFAKTEIIAEHVTTLIKDATKKLK